jgi:7-cyano-7-deazaguanine synthase
MIRNQMMIDRDDSGMTRCAVLLSGGLDSAVLVADEATRFDVQPIYISAGLAWEAAERLMVEQLLASTALRGRVAPLVTLSVDMRDVYATTHWALTGRPPEYDTPDEDVYLPGRNIVLLSKAGVFCAAARIGRLVMGTLAHNPFPDATEAFRGAMAQALSLGLAHDLRVDAPFANMEKAEVVRRGVDLGVPFELTLSCMNPVRGTGLRTGRAEAAVRYGDPSPVPVPVHCGACSKCRERHDAFLAAGLADPTEYAETRHLA